MQSGPHCTPRSTTIMGSCTAAVDDQRAQCHAAELLNAWGRRGRQLGQFKWVHNMIDAKGNLYTAGLGRVAQKFKRMN